MTLWRRHRYPYRVRLHWAHGSTELLADFACRNTAVAFAEGYRVPPGARVNVYAYARGAADPIASFPAAQGADPAAPAE